MCNMVTLCARMCAYLNSKGSVAESAVGTGRQDVVAAVAAAGPGDGQKPRAPARRCQRYPPEKW